MRRLVVAAAVLACLAVPDGRASEIDNDAGHYRLSTLPSAASEAKRMDRMELDDQQPAGRWLRRGESAVITVEGLPRGVALDAAIGFRPMWKVALGQQIVRLVAGDNRIQASQEGPLFFRCTARAGAKPGADEVDVTMAGGHVLPLYVDGETSPVQWATQLDEHGDAPFVQFLGEHAMITLTRAVHAEHPVADPAATFEAIDEVLGYEDEVAGLDGSSPRDAPTPLRMHYVVDFRAKKKDLADVYMYAEPQFIGMLPDNTEDLTDPDRLRERWGIWHETGHTHQQNSWTWGALTEINVNLFSLYVQEKLGLPSRLAESEDGEPSAFDRARRYLAGGRHDLLADVPDDDGDLLFTRLVLFHQLKSVYGWRLFQDLHKEFRAHPLPADSEDQEMADALVTRICAITGNDLRPFFRRWGLRVSDAADAQIERRHYPAPRRDPAAVFQ